MGAAFLLPLPQSPIPPLSAEVLRVLSEVSREDERGDPHLPQAKEVDLPQVRQGPHAAQEGELLAGVRFTDNELANE